MKELFNERIIELLDKKTQSLMTRDEYSKETITALSDMEAALESTLSNIKKTIYKIHCVVGRYRHKVEEQMNNQKYTFEDWARSRDFFKLKREKVVISEPGKFTQDFEAFIIHYTSVISKFDEDVETAEESLGNNTFKFDKFAWDRVLAKVTRDIEEYSNNLLLQIFPKGPKRKIEKKNELVRNLSSRTRLSDFKATKNQNMTTRFGDSTENFSSTTFIHDSPNPNKQYNIKVHTSNQRRDERFSFDSEVQDLSLTTTYNPDSKSKVLDKVVRAGEHKTQTFILTDRGFTFAGKNPDGQRRSVDFKCGSILGEETLYTKNSSAGVQDFDDEMFSIQEGCKITLPIQRSYPISVLPEDLNKGKSMQERAPSVLQIMYPHKRYASCVTATQQ